MSVISETVFLPDGIPDPDCYVSVEQWMSTTPESFSIKEKSPIVLYHQTSGLSVKLVAPTALQAQLSRSDPSKGEAKETVEPSGRGTVLFARTDDTDNIVRFVKQTAVEPTVDANDEFVVAGLTAWVTSHALFIATSPTTTGLRIPYPQIATHALLCSSAENPGGVMLSLKPSPEQRRLGSTIKWTPSEDDDDYQQLDDDCDDDGWSIVISLPPAGVDKETQPEGDEKVSLARKLYDALSECANLHPDPVDDMDMGGLGFGGEEDDSEGDDDDGRQDKPAISIPIEIKVSLGSQSEQTEASEEGKRRRPDAAGPDDEEGGKWRCL